MASNKNFAKQNLFKKIVLDKFSDIFDLHFEEEATVGNYDSSGSLFLDFYNRTHKICIEFDETHHKNQKTSDELRDEFLNYQYGIKVIRVDQKDSVESGYRKVAEAFGVYAEADQDFGEYSGKSILQISGRDARYTFELPNELKNKLAGEAFHSKRDMRDILIEMLMERYK